MGRQDFFAVPCRPTPVPPLRSRSRHPSSVYCKGGRTALMSRKVETVPTTHTPALTPRGKGRSSVEAEGRGRGGTVELVRQSQPELITLGPSTRLVSVEALAHELSLLVWEAKEFLTGLGVRTVLIGHQEYVLLPALELAIWKRTVDPEVQLDSDPVRAAQQINELGRIYRGMTRDVVEKRLASTLDPLRQIRRRRTRRQK